MDIQRAVKAFIADGKDLYHRFRSSGEGLSDLDLVALREQLYILDMEAGRLQENKDSRSDGASARRSFSARRCLLCFAIVGVLDSEKRACRAPVVQLASEVPV